MASTAPHLQFGGPHDYWSDQKPPSRGQWKTIAQLACELLEIGQPDSRADASVTIDRLRAANLQAAATDTRPAEVPPPW